MAVGVMEITMAVSVFFYELVDIIPLLFFIIAPNNDTSVVEYSCLRHMFG